MATFGSGILGSSQIADGAITTAKLADDAVTNVKVSTSAAIAWTKLAAINQATVEAQTNITTTSTTYVDVTNMTITATFNAKPTFVIFTSEVSSSVSNGRTTYQIIEGAAVKGGSVILSTTTAAGEGNEGTVHTMYTSASGSQTIKAQWRTNAGTATQENSTEQRRMTAIEFS